MKYVTLFFLAMLSGLGGRAQTPVQQRLPEQLQKWQQEMPEEKIYLHLDKDIYLTGETVWIKAYLLDGFLHQASYLSSVVYLELLNPQDSVVIRHLIEVKEGEGNASMALPKALATGSYHLRAYTQWMRNRETEYQTSIQVINPLQPESLAPARWRTQQTLDVQFLPEGGQLVAGLTSQVGIKAIGANGLGIAVSGEIVDQHNQVLTTFKTENKGMGSLSLKPVLGKTYRARYVLDGQTDTLEQILPKAERSGFVMQVNSNAMFVEVNLQSSPDLKAAEFILLAQVRGQIVSLVRAKLRDNQYQVAIPNYKVPAGVMQITLFDTEGRPLCERLSFVRGNEALKLEITPNKTRYRNREAVELSLRASDQSGKPVAGYFSLSVADIAAYWESPDRNHLLSQIWLSADLKGFVESPEYYFSGQSEAIDRDLDLLMLTQGWRKYDWEALQAERYPRPQHLIEQGLMVSGSIQTALGKTPKTAIVNLMADNILNTYTTQAIDGQFVFTGLEYSDTSRLVLQALTENNKAKYFNIQLDEKTFPPPSLYPYFDLRPDPAKEAERDQYVDQMQQQLEADAIREGELVINAEEVEIQGRRTEEATQLVENGLYKEATYSMKGADAFPSYNVLDALRGQMPGVKVNGTVGNYSVFIRGVNSLSGSVQPLMLLDGNIVDVTILETILMSQVDRVDVLSGAAAGAYGMRGSSGVIAVYTNEGYIPGGDAEERLGLLRTELAGFHYAKKFYSPNYAVTEESHSLPDLRTTLYWNPMVRTDEKGEATLTFFTGDTDGAFQIILEGFTRAGFLGRQTQQIEVLD